MCCDKSSNGMEPCDTCDVNSFQCKINGVDWKSDCIPDPPFGCNSISITFDDNANDIEITGINEYLKSSIKLNARSLKIDSRTSLKDNSGYSDRNLTGGCNSFELELDTSISYIKIMNLDNNNRVLTCIFEMRCLGICGEVININEGKFSTKY